MVNKMFFNRLRVFSLIVLTTILTTCKPERDNPWDILANISPDEWAPNNLSIENVNILEKIISWNYSGDNRIQGFKLDRKVGNDNWEVAHQAFDKSTKSWNDTDITPDSTIIYSYRLYSFAGDKESTEVTITSKPSFPAPTNLQIEKVNEIKYKLTWTDNSIGEQGFKIDRRTDNGDWTIAHGVVDANQTAYIDTNVFVAKSSINIEYRIYAYYQSYETTKAFANTNAALTPPSNLQITQNSITSVTLNWTDNSTGEEGFRVERKHGSGEWQQIAQTKETTLNDNEFELNTTVYYRISAYIEEYNSAYAEANFDATIPPPTNLTIYANSNTSITLSWDYTQTGYQGFKVDRRIDEGAWEECYVSLDATQRTYTDNAMDFTSNNLYSYRLYAYHELQNSEKVDTYIGKPILNTLEVTAITATTATSGGNITNDSGSAITDRGIVWSTSQNPTVDSNQGITSNGSGTGSWESELVELQPGTVYYVRAYATNSLGTQHGNQFSFSTWQGEVSDIDGNIYRTVVIGNQDWMAENLRTTRYRNGIDIPTGLSLNDWGNTTSGAFAIYPYSSIDGFSSVNEVLKAYGALYNFYAVADSRGLCPTGWHVPTDAEWQELVDYVVNQGYPNNSWEVNGASNALKSCRQVSSPLGGDCATSTHPRWDLHSTHFGTNQFGFSTIPGGACDYVGDHFVHIGRWGYWWSSSEYDVSNAWRNSMGNESGWVTFSYNSKKLGFSVRCVKDN
jgi:uncharacterized protein (TIGR02145 family)